MTRADSRCPSLIRAELPLWVSILTSLLIFFFGPFLRAHITQPLWFLPLFFGLFCVILWSAFAVVRHEDCLAIKLGEPFGTIFLTLALVSIEVEIVSAMMLTGAGSPTLARDTIYAVLMIVLNGLVGVSLLIGGFRHMEQQFNLEGANAYLTVILPLAVLGLILPNFTRSTVDPTFSHIQAVFFILITIGLYGVFLRIKTNRHRAYFLVPESERDQLEEDDTHEIPDYMVRSVSYHSLFLVAYLIPLVFIAYKFAVPVKLVISKFDAPPALAGILVAVLVLSPKAVGAIHSALNNRLQCSVNTLLGTALAIIGLMIPAVLIIGFVTGRKVILGLSSVDMTMLLLTLVVCSLTFGRGRTTVLQGVVHLLLFFAYLVLIFD